MKEVLNSIYNFLVTYDFPTLLACIRKADLGQVAASVYTWLIALPVLIVLIWTKSIKIIVALISLFLFVLLIRNTFSQAGETLPLRDLITFLGGSVALVGVNLYFIFIRQ